jgi:hypothetical protein
MAHNTLKKWSGHSRHKFVVSLSNAGQGWRMVHHLGLLRFLEKQGIMEDVAEIWGVGNGALIAGSYALTGKSFEVFALLLKIQKHLQQFDLFKFIKGMLPRYQHIQSAGIYDFKALEKDFAELMEDQKQKYPFYALAYDINKSVTKILSPDRQKTINQIVTASMAQAGIHRPKEIADEFFLDGSMQEPLPLQSIVAKWEADRMAKRDDRDRLIILACDLTGFTKNISESFKANLETPKSYFEMLNFAYDVRFHEIVSADLAKASSLQNVEVIHLQCPLWPHLNLKGSEHLAKSLDLAEAMFSLQLQDERLKGILTDQHNKIRSFQFLLDEFEHYLFQSRVQNSDLGLARFNFHVNTELVYFEKTPIEVKLEYDQLMQEFFKYLALDDVMTRGKNAGEYYLIMPKQNSATQLTLANKLEFAARSLIKDHPYLYLEWGFKCLPGQEVCTPLNAMDQIAMQPVVIKHEKKDLVF